MIKKLILSFYLLLYFFMLWGGAVFASGRSWGTYGDTPMEILDNVVDRSDQHNQQQTLVEPNLNNTTFGADMKISNTLDSIRSMIWPYLQWMLYIWLAWWTILIIRNGFLLTTSFGDEWKKKDIVARIKNILIGILIITWFYFLIKLVLALITFITWAETVGW